MREMLICVDGGKGIGLGHISRGLGLMDAAKAAFEGVHIAIPAGCGLRTLFHSAACAVHEIDWAVGSLLDLAKSLGTTFLTVDSYRFEPEALGVFERDGIRVLVFDDGAHMTYPVSVVVNGSPSARDLNYRVGIVLSGPAYQVVRPQFVIDHVREFGGPLQNVLVTIGGDDLMEIAVRLFDRISEHCSRYHPKVMLHYVIGPFMRLSQRKWRANEIAHDAPPDMRTLMLSADIAISAGGQTLYELARCACPTIAVCTGGDQERNILAMVDAGCVLYAGWGNTDAALDAIVRGLDELMGSEARRRELGLGAGMLVDGFGARRIVERAAQILGDSYG